MNCLCKARKCSQCTAYRRGGCHCISQSTMQGNHPSPPPLKRRKRTLKRVRYENDGLGLSGGYAESETQRIDLPILLKLLDLGQLAHNLPASRKTISVGDASNKDLARCDNVLHAIMRQTCALIYPADPAQYFDTRLSYSHQMKPALLLSKRHDIMVALKATPRESIERRVLRAVLCSAMPREQMQKYMNSSNVCLNEINDSEMRNDTRIFPETYASSRIDWDTLLVHGKLENIKLQVCRVMNSQIEFMVRYIFSRQNIQLLSWGTKRVVVSGNEFVLPAVTRKKKLAV